MLTRRYFCTQISKGFLNSPNQNYHRQWAIKQVTKTNFAEELEKFKNHISDSDFVAVSLQKTGAYSAPWHRVLPFDTADIAYFKAKYAAERYQVFQFAVCPFSVEASNSKLVAHPYNFHLFPRDEFKMGMPCYSFSCQPSYLASMAREGFDFNVCIYDGISYLSKVQEPLVKEWVGNQLSACHVVQSPSSHSVADQVFVERVKSRVGHWISACKDSSPRNEDALLSSLRKLIVGGEVYGSRPSLNIDVCSERQVQLVLQMLKSQPDNVVPLIIPAKGGGTQAVRLVLTSSKEDRDLFEKELQDMEEEQNKRIRGFREVIDLISTSQKPVVAHNSLNDFTFIHSKFLGPLPPTMDEFKSSLSSVFPVVLDVNHLMKEITPLSKVHNLPAALSYLKGRFYAPIDMEIPRKADNDESKNHGHNALRISQLFAKLCFILKITPESVKPNKANLLRSLQGYTNIFNPGSCGSLEDHTEDQINIWSQDTRKVSNDNLVFLWGFRTGISAGMLKSLLLGTHELFSNGSFNVRLVCKSCAIVVFCEGGASKRFLNAMDSGESCSEALLEMISQGLAAAGYEKYTEVCKSNLWEANLADSLDKALAEPNNYSDSHSESSSELYWKELTINIDDL